MRSNPAEAKSDPANRSTAMIAVYTIVAFLVVVGALNVFEFGRLD